MDRIKSRWILFAFLVLALTVLAVWMDRRENRLDDRQARLDAFMQMVEQPDTLVQPEAPEFFVVDSTIDNYMRPGLCGYTHADRTAGVITVSRDIPREQYIKVLPDFIPDTTAAYREHNAILYIRPGLYFPDGECGRVTGILVNDTIIQVQFVQTSPEEVAENITGSIDRILRQIRQLPDSLQSNR